MKKIILFVSILIGCMNYADAQIRFGLKGGANFANFSSNSGSNFKLSSATGWQAGAMLVFDTPIIGIQPELLYTVRKGDVETASGSSENSISYFEVPVNLRWSLNLRILRPYLLAGPYFSYAASFTGDSFNKDNIERFDWGIGLGGGIEIWKLQFGLRYSWGLQDIAKTDNQKIKNKTLTVSLGYLF